MSQSVRASVAIISAAFIWLAALLQVLQTFNATGGTPPAYDDAYRDNIRVLDPTTLRQYWAYKSSQLGVDVMIDLLAALGLAGLAYCVLILKRVFKKYKGGFTDVPAFMTAAFFIGAILPSIGFLQAVGYTTTADLVSQTPGLPDTGIQALSISYNLARGGNLYIFSTQFVCSSVGLFIASYLTWTTGELPKKHAIFGFITSFFALLTFIMEIIAFNVGGASGIVLGVVIFIYGIILLPIWLIWLGVILRRLKLEQKREQMYQMDEKLTKSGEEIAEKEETS